MALWIGIAASVKNGNVAPSSLTHPLLRIIFDFTVRGMTTKCGVLERSLFSVVSGIFKLSVEHHFTAFASIPPPIFIWIWELPYSSVTSSHRSIFKVCNSDSCLTQWFTIPKWLDSLVPPMGVPALLLPCCAAIALVWVCGWRFSTAVLCKWILNLYPWGVWILSTLISV